jgi:hypothetical protein
MLGIIGRARSGSLSARKKEESPKEKEIQLELNIKVCSIISLNHAPSYFVGHQERASYFIFLV